MKLVVFSPTDVTQRLVDVLSAAGAGAIGDYERCAFWVAGTGTFVPGAGSDPAVGRPGERTETHEDRLEMVLPPERLPAALQALRAVHPYEEPAYDVVPVLMPTQRAFGRVGTLREPVRLSDAAGWLARSLPASAAGVRVAGADRVVRRVAVCGGAGDDFIGDAARRGADLYVTADLRHHVTREAVEAGLALADVGHWSSEAPWLASAARLLRDDLAERGHELTCDASTLVTDPWSDHQPGGSRT
jgi:hypothetical protein